MEGTKAREVIQPSARAMRKLLEWHDSWTERLGRTPRMSVSRGQLLARLWIAEIREQVANGGSNR